MRSVLPILTVVAVIVVLWYAAAVKLNAAWVHDTAARAGAEAPAFSQVIA
jgi:NitT/TauT family transport system permease protein